MDRGEKRVPDERRVPDDHIEQLIDEALEETFPASDPPAPAVDARPANSSPVVPSKRS
jgi:hypothetical protein